MQQRAIILGSTGSIGCNALDVLAGLNGEWNVVGLAAGSRGRELGRQANRFRPQAVAIASADLAGELEGELSYS
ncbi:MAG: 1-deoxy-D-xylulose-5-phosphate reductoisomerase, partial [Planctomycetota bacterium]